MPRVKIQKHGRDGGVRRGLDGVVVSSVVVLLELFLLSVSGEKQKKHSHSGGGGWFTAHPCGETDGMLTFIR